MKSKYLKKFNIVFITYICCCFRLN
jgi:hypothetical protein